MRITQRCHAPADVGLELMDRAYLCKATKVIRAARDESEMMRAEDAAFAEVGRRVGDNSPLPVNLACS